MEVPGTTRSYFVMSSWAVVAEQSLKEGELNKLQNRETTSLQKSARDKRA